MRSVVLSRLSIAVALIACWASHLVADPPSLTHLFPAGGQRGTKVEVTCYGKFDWPTEVHAPGLSVVAKGDSGKLEVTIPDDFPADRAWIRLYNAEGATQLAPFLVGSIAEINETEPNDSPKQSESLDANAVVVNGVIARGDSDCFAVQMEAGQTLVAAVDSHSRLGSPIDLILQVVLPNGIVVADNHDANGLDPRVHFTASTAGRYIVRLFGFASQPNQDISLQGCGECVYRLTMTTGPYAALAIPLAVQSLDSASAFKMLGWNLLDNQEVKATWSKSAGQSHCLEVENPGDLRIPQESELGFVHSLQFAGGARVRRVPFVSSQNIQDVPASDVFSVTLPQAVTGLLSRKGQLDRYQIYLKSGDSLIVTLESRTLGLPVDPLLRLINPNGNRVTEVDDSAGTRDALLVYDATEEGNYIVEVADRSQAGGEHAYYLLTARLDQPDYELTAKADRITVPAKGTAELAIQVVRRKNVGSIVISPVGLPDGVSAEPVVSAPEGDSSAQVTLKLLSNGQPFSGPLRLVGNASEPFDIQRHVRTESRLGISFTEVWLTVSADSKAEQP